MSFFQAFAAYRALDPAGWVGIYRHVPAGAGVVAAIAGLALLLVGGGRAFRVVAGPVGALAGFAWAPGVAEKLGVTGLDPQVAAGAAVALGVLGLGFPPGAVFFAFGLPAGLAVGGFVARSDFMIGFAPAFLLVGAASAFFHRYVACVAASMVGAWLLLIGLLAALHQVGGVVGAVTAQPWGVILAAALVAIAGSVFQLAVRPSPEEAERRQVETAIAKRKAADQTALEERWANYSAKKK